MSKISLTNLVNLQNETTAVNAINANNATLTTALDNTLSRDGTSPNTMSASLDMNSNRILNLPAPVSNAEPARLVDIGNAPASATAAAASAAAAATSASAASASATTASGYIAGLSGTSSTSLLIATGAKTFTANTGKLWATGQFVTAASNANSANYMHGTVTSYNSTTGALVTNILDIGGSGTFADWNLAISGTAGPQGIPGSGTIAGAVNHGVGLATGATAMTSTAVMSDGQLLVGQTAADPLPKTITGDVTFTAAGATAIKTSVSLTTPVLGAATATSINKVALTQPATNATLTIADTKTLTCNNNLTLSGTDGSTLAVGPGGTLTGSSSSAVFYDNIPQNSQSVAYQLVASDAQKHIFHPSADTTARTWTIPANGTVAFPIGTSVTFVNQNSAGVITIAITTDTMRIAGTGTTGNRTLAANGIATALKVTSTEWIISGTGLT